MERDRVIELIKQKGITDPENPSNKDILKLLELESNNQLDEVLLKEYFQYVSGVVPKVFESLKGIAQENVSKEYINSINKRIDVLNKEYENAKTEEDKDKNHQKVLELYKLIGEESDKQRTWINKLIFGGLGTLVILGGVAIGTRNKEAGKKMIEEGSKVIVEGAKSFKG